MQSLRHYTIRTRLLGLGLLSVLALLLIGGAGLWAMGSSRSDFQQYVAQDVGALTQLSEVRAGIGNLRRFEKDMLINIGDDGTVKQAQADWQKTYAGVIRSLDTLSTLEASPDLSLATALRAAVDSGESISPNPMPTTISFQKTST